MASGHYAVRVRAPFDPGLYAAGPRADAPDPAELLRAHYGAAAGWALGAARQGLALALEAAGVGEGDAVAMADFNCSSMIGPVRDRGARFAFTDVRADWTYDVDDLARLVRETRAKALVLTHYFGKSCVTPALAELVADLQSRGVAVVEDCAHTLCDAEQPEIGTLGDVALFSFGNDKAVAVGKCGVALARNPALAGRMAELAAKLPERDAARERLLVTWNYVYWFLTAPEICRPGIVSVPARCDAPPGEGEFADMLAAVAESPSLDTLRRFPAAASLIEHCGEGGAGEPSRPALAGRVVRTFAGLTLGSGLLAQGNAARSRNRAFIESAAGLPSGRGARLRYTVAYPDAAAADRAARAARAAGVEADCFNWSPLMSEELGIARAHPAWAVLPARVVNYPVHGYLTEGDLVAIAEVVR